MAYDHLAPWYEFLEKLTFGPSLHRCRIQYLDAMREQLAAGPILILGDGDGRFLEAWLKRYPNSSVDTLDFSQGMLDLSKQRIQRWAAENQIQVQELQEQVKWIRADALGWEFPVNHYQGIVTHFFLDSFTPDASLHLIPSIASALKPGGFWLCSDFQIPGSGNILAKWRAQIWVAFLYGCFQALTETRTNQLTDPVEMMQRAGMKRIHMQTSQWNLLKSEYWLKNLGERTTSPANGHSA